MCVEVIVCNTSVVTFETQCGSALDSRYTVSSQLQSFSSHCHYGSTQNSSSQNWKYLKLDSRWLLTSLNTSSTKNCEYYYHEILSTIITGNVSTITIELWVLLPREPWVRYHYHGIVSTIIMESVSTITMALWVLPWNCEHYYDGKHECYYHGKCEYYYQSQIVCVFSLHLRCISTVLCTAY